MTTKTRKVDVQIKNPDGSIVFEKKSFEVPEDWSDRAATIVASKYAMNNENSAIDIIERVAKQITKWGVEEGYFNKTDETGLIVANRFYFELTKILINQRASFNSPVWFNIGSDTGTNQASGCFIVPVEDTMESILEHNTIEGKIFRGGSGAGCNVSSLRAKGEKLSNKGIASGPLSFMNMWDTTAGAIRSGGKTRRSAKMVCLDADHPDIMEFIKCKLHEEKKAKALIAAGISPEEAYATVSFQNTNHSIRVTDEFMEAVKADKKYVLYNRNTKDPHSTVMANDILDTTAEIAWETGDPGIQFHDRMNIDNPVPSIGVINSTNPCSEFAAVDNSSCNLASLNLVKYLKQKSYDGIKLYDIDYDKFQKDIKVLITAMDILVDAADYPTLEITEMTKDTRPLGLGFCNLGAMLMLLNVEYDSNKGRTIASNITRVMTSTAYEKSIELGKRLGSFKYFEDNINQNADIIERLTENKQLADKAVSNGLRNSQVTLLAPTGCLTGDTLVLSSEGLLPIEELGYGDDKWQDIRITVPQETGLFKSNKFYINGKDKTLRITTSKGHEIKCTDKHKFRVIDKNGDYVWKKAKELIKSDLMAIRLGGHEELLGDKNYINLRHPTKDGTIKVDEHFANVIGYYMGDGYLKETGGVHFVINNEDTDLLNIFNNWADRTETKITREEKEGCFIAHNNSRATYRWFHELEFAKEKGNRGEGAASAFIPIHILSSRSSVLSAFLSGLFEADGTISFGNQTPTIELCTVSKTLATQVMTAMESLGIPIKLNAQEPREDSKGNRIKYRIRISSLDGIYTFSNKINFLSNRKKEKLNNWMMKEIRKDNPKVLSSNSSRHLSIRNHTLLKDLHKKSINLSSKIKQDIAARKRQSKFNLRWAKKMIFENDELKDSKIAKILSLSNSLSLQFINVESVVGNGIEETYDISVPENNTYIANSFVTHNTISFMMDADTTGIEPLFALQTIKTLAGGGTMVIDYPCVEEARELYGSDNERLFATANEISWKAHIDMMAACQKHLNGAISKTVNMSYSNTIEDIKGAYLYAWESGLKCLAVYRDGCKDMQPMMDSSRKEEEKKESIDEETGWSPFRKALPNDRQSITHKFNVGGLEGYLTIGMYEEGHPGEIFIRCQKQGSTMQGVLDSFATAVSLALQYGVPLETLIDKFTGSKFEPAGFTMNEDIRMTTSIMDYMFRYLQLNFIDDEEDESAYEKEIPIESSSIPTVGKFDGPPCTTCGTITGRNGTCYLCPQCGTTTGCG